MQKSWRKLQNHMIYWELDSFDACLSFSGAPWSACKPGHGLATTLQRWVGRGRTTREESCLVDFPTSSDCSQTSTYHPTTRIASRMTRQLAPPSCICSSGHQCTVMAKGLGQPAQNIPTPEQTMLQIAETFPKLLHKFGGLK